MDPGMTDSPRANKPIPGVVIGDPVSPAVPVSSPADPESLPDWWTGLVKMLNKCCIDWKIVSQFIITRIKKCCVIVKRATGKSQFSRCIKIQSIALIQIHC